MAAENISSVKPIFQEKVGARLLVVGEVKLPAEYKTEGCQFSEKQLQELGLTLGQVDCGWIVSSGKAAKNAEQIPCQLNITKPGVGEAGQVVAIQCYESITTAINKELASAGTKAGSGVVFVALIGR